MSRTKSLVIALAVCAAVGGGIWVYTRTPSAAPTPASMNLATTTSLHIGSVTVVAEVADTPAARERGLGGRTHLEEGTGMWFVFDTDGLWPFWMKDTLIPLDIIWVDAAGTIVHIASNVQPSSYPQSFAPATPARYVLEVPAGYTAARGITKGDLVIQK